MDETMQGHLVVTEEGCVLVDPPYVHGLIEEVEKIGRVRAAIITTLDHTRSVVYLQRKIGIEVYIPDQGESLTINPDEYMKCRGVREHLKYGQGKILDFTAHRLTVEGVDAQSMPYMDEYELLTGEGELITGDIAVGTRDGRILIAPEWFPILDEPHNPAHAEFKRVVKKTDAVTMLSTHGYGIRGKLQEAADRIP